MAGLPGGPVYELAVMPVRSPAGTTRINQRVVAGGNLVLTAERGTGWVARPGTGAVTSLVAAPDGVVFATGPDGSAWRSSEYGRAWVRLNVRANTPVRFTAISPLYQSDALAMAVAAEEWKLYRYDKATDQWIEAVMRAGERIAIGAAAISPAFEGEETIFAGTERGIYRSANNGQTWSLVAGPDKGAPVFGPAAGPADGQRIVLPDDYGDDPRNPYDLDDRTVFAFNASGAYRSDDDGASWRRLPLDVGRIRDLAISNAWPADRVLLAAVDEPGQVGAVSRDGGLSWTPIPGPAGIAGASAAVARDFGKPGFRVPRPPGVNRDIQLPIVVRQALDRVTWPEVDLGSREMYLGTLGDGLWRSNDAGRTWDAVAPTETLTNVQATSLAFVSDDPEGEVLAATELAGFYRSADGGRTWRAMASDLPRGEGQTIHRLAASPDVGRDSTLFAAATSGVWVSRDRGRTWSRTPGPAPAETLALSPAFARDRTLVAAGHISTDAGQTWAPLGEGSGFPWRAIAFSPAFETDRTLWAGRKAAPGEALDYLLYRSNDAGRTWTPVVSSTLRQTAILDIALVAVAADPMRVFVGTETGLLMSRDNGATWTRPAGVPSRRVASVVARLLTAPFTTAVVAVGAEDGVAWSTNRGVDWQRAPQQIRDARAVSLSTDATAIVGVLPVTVARYADVFPRAARR